MYQVKRQFIHDELKLSEMIIENPNFIRMLQHFNLNLPVNDRTITQICSENNIDKELFLAVANLFNGTTESAAVKYSPGSIEVIIEYLRNSHKYYLEEKYPLIENYIKQMAELNAHSEMTLVEKFFREYFNEVSEHLKYEDDTVFPYIIRLNQLLQNRGGDPLPDFSAAEYKEHHDNIEEKLADLKNLLIKYLPGRSDNQIRNKLIFSLFELEYDLTIHSHIEDYILIPLAEEMEKKRNER